MKQKNKRPLAAGQKGRDRCDSIAVSTAGLGSIGVATKIPKRGATRISFTAFGGGSFDLTKRRFGDGKRKDGDWEGCFPVSRVGVGVYGKKTLKHR